MEKFHIWKWLFIKYDITWDKNSSFDQGICNLYNSNLTNENIGSWMKLQVLSVVRSSVWKTNTTKHLIWEQTGVLWEKKLLREIYGEDYV